MCGKILVIVLLLVGTQAVLRAGVIRPHVTTDKSVDCSSVESIVRDVCAGLTSDQDKAIALFNFARRLMFPWPNRADRVAVHDTLHLLNTYGYSFCSQQALLTVHLWQAAGIKGYVWAVPGHSTMQAQYDGDHHWFDLLIGAYVYRRDGKTIASLQDIAKDPTLLTKAVEEGRAPPGFLPERTVLRDDAARFSKHNPEYIKTCAGYGDDLTFMAKLAPQARKWRWGGPRPSRYRPGFTLRRGERVVYLWDFLPDQANCKVLRDGQKPRAYWVAASELPPHHYFGIAAQKRDVNWKYFRPYVKTVNGVETGRYAANGRHIYAPDLSALRAGDFRRNTFRRRAGGSAGPVLAVGRRGSPAELVFRMHTPHVYTGAVISADFQRADTGDVSCIYVSRSGRKWVKVWDAERAGPGRIAAKVELKAQVRGARDVWVKFVSATTGPANRAGLDAVTVEMIFQHNMFARPYLVPGANRVTVRADGGEALRTGQFTVTFTWRQGARRRQHSKRIASSPTTYTIEVGGKELPRMLSLELAVGR